MLQYIATSQENKQRKENKNILETNMVTAILSIYDLIQEMRYNMLMDFHMGWKC